MPQGAGCSPLKAGRQTSQAGTDSVGAFTETAIAYQASDGTSFATGVRAYASAEDVAVLTQHFPDGLEPRATPARDQAGKPGKPGKPGPPGSAVASAFPTFAGSALDLGVLMYAGVQLQDTRYYHWKKGEAFDAGDPQAAAFKKGKFDADGGAMPLVLTSASGHSLVVSPLDDFFTACQTVSTDTGNFSVGMQSTVGSVPKGHLHRTIVVAGTSVTQALMRWGDLFLASAGGGKERSMKYASRAVQFHPHGGQSDFVWLSARTPHGAYGW